jgi:uncharacterized protein
MSFARNIKGYSSIAVGMVSTEEVEFNINYFNGTGLKNPPNSLINSKRVMVFRGLCKGCKACISACPNSAVFIDEDGKAVIDKNKCLTCGYCTPSCPQFAIRVV